MSKARILIVEDEAIVAEDLSQKLERLGYEVCGAIAGGEEAIGRARALRPELVLMDIRLKGRMDGVEAAQIIRQDFDLPVIFLTAHSDPGTLQRAKLTEPFGYILKPFEELELETHIQVALYKHQADQEVRRQREWLRVTLQSIGDAVVTTDAAGKVTSLNPVAEEMTGWKIAEALNHPIEEVFNIINEKTGKPAPNPVEKVLKEGKVVGLANHTALISREGKPWAIEDSAAPIKDAQGRVLGVVMVFHDVTEKRLAEEALARSKEELERLVAERTAKLQELVGELEHFSYSITHDMRAPLRAMQGFAEMMNEECATCHAPEPKMFLQRIGTSARRMDSLITDALNYNKTVRQELPLEPVDAGALLRGMLDSYPELQPSRAQIEIAGEIPLVLGNEAGLTQCFSNLLGNAVKFVKPGQKPEVRVWAEERPDGWVRLWVEDKGIGIPASMISRVFDMFSRGHTTYEGTGIGLALVRKVAHRMGGKVGVESELGKGSRFWLEFKAGDLGLLSGNPVGRIG
jgi:PAS domain S-box-containing protein